MKKKIFHLSALVLGLIFISSCTDNNLKYIATAPAAGEFKLTSSLDSIVLHETGGGAHTAIAFQWDSMVYKVSTPVTYTIQIDTLNGNFANPLEEEIATDTYKISYSDSILNKKCLNLLMLKPDVRNIIQVRIKANLAFGNMPVYSNVKTLKITPYSVRKIVSFMYMPGDVSGGWSKYTTMICSKNNDGKYEGYVQAAQWANFKFTNKSDGTGTFYGSSATLGLYTLDASAAQWNIWFDAGGYFMVKADLNLMTWSKTAVTSFCVTGDFNSWSLTANPMTYDAVNNVWTASCNISTIGYGFQIIGNGDWSYKYGDNNGGKDSGELTLGGANIMPASTGTRTVTMDLSHPEKYTYTIK
jgi:hypothetical protein